MRLMTALIIIAVIALLRSIVVLIMRLAGFL